MSEIKWYEPNDPSPRELCPCCDYVTLPERGSYLICPICFWEDEGQDIYELDSYSGPNHMCLREGRINFNKYGACDKDMVKNVISISERKNFEHRPRTM